MSEGESHKDRYPWAGPALFIIVAALLLAFFTWFVQA